MSAAIFGVATAAVAYVLAGYPALLAILSRRGSRSIRSADTLRTVSVILPVHNGEQWIRQKLDTLASLDYPRHLVEVIVVDDGSTDATAEVVRNTAFPLVLRLIKLPRGGKAVALNAGIEAATGEILFFTDVRQRLDRASLRSLVAHLNDPDVGAVSGELIILAGDTMEEANIGLYWRYEKWMRRRLSALDSVLGATGCIYAMKRDLAVRLPPSTILDDVFLPLAVFFQGFRVTFNEDAKAYDVPTALGTEFRRKVRTQAGVYQIVAAFPRLLLPTNRMWVHFMSHKCGRLLLPFALLTIAGSSFGLPAPWAGLAVGTQLMFYLTALSDAAVPQGWKLKRITALPRTFVVLVGAALCAPVFLLMNRGRGGWATTTVQAELPADGRVPR